MKNFFQRAITAAAFVLVLLSATYRDFTFTILFSIVTLLGTLEFYKLAEKDGTTSPQRLMGAITAGVMFLTNAIYTMYQVNIRVLLFILPFVFLIFIIELYRKKKEPFRNIAFTILGIIYVGVPFTLLNYILTCRGNYSPQILYGFFFILWSSDTGAYLSGSLLGKNKLFPRVSPGKSWEGSIGGAILSYIVAYIMADWFTIIHLRDWMVIATILIVIGTLGDLVESLFKRSINVKDSGSILPGHGGILDRFDSLLMATPFVFTYLYLIKNIYL
ncbi:MAG TPA: phosphatidate cytidylyltransferase [Bacteroidia bacterium]|nr:phosphatidate cytidylyltransferase [Bacteroidia bacterium]HRG52901.1 phosphatidate cytidylyltransferase [Bacteroidia bacterium]